MMKITTLMFFLFFVVDGYWSKLVIRRHSDGDIILGINNKHVCNRIVNSRWRRKESTCQCSLQSPIFHAENVITYGCYSSDEIKACGHGFISAINSNTTISIATNCSNDGILRRTYDFRSKLLQWENRNDLMPSYQSGAITMVRAVETCPGCLLLSFFFCADLTKCFLATIEGNATFAALNTSTLFASVPPRSTTRTPSTTTSTSLKTSISAVYSTILPTNNLPFTTTSTKKQTRVSTASETSTESKLPIISYIANAVLLLVLVIIIYRWCRYHRRKNVNPPSTISINTHREVTSSNKIELQTGSGDIVVINGTQPRHQLTSEYTSLGITGVPVDGYYATLTSKQDVVVNNDYEILGYRNSKESDSEYVQMTSSK